jgi:hypothetical protein
MDWKDFWTEYLATLGGMATILAALGFLTKTLVEQWFKKGYKKWESELEQRFKEDLKRYESKLDIIGARDTTKFDLLHNKRVEAINSLYAQVTVAFSSFNSFLLAYNVVQVLKTTNGDKNVTIKQNAFLKDLDALRKMYAFYRLYFDDQTNKLVEMFMYYVGGHDCDSLRYKDDLDLIRMKTATRFAGVEMRFKELLGVTNCEEPTGGKE